MVNSLELILGEISKAEVKLGKNTGRVALNLFEYQEVIELSFNGHKSLLAYDRGQFNRHVLSPRDVS